jgi:large subunit ribosomal protein L9
MKVLLLKDVYKLGRAGDVKKVADGYGRNYLIPQGMAVLATAGAVKQADSIRSRATEQRNQLNQEMSGTAERLTGLVIGFPVRAGETGKLYGSITTQMIADAIGKKTGVTIDRREIECQPIRNLGEHKCTIRLTVDLNPEITVIAHREGELPKALAPKVVEAPAAEAAVEEQTETAEAVEETPVEE